MKIEKQRYLCHSCNSTQGGITELVKENQTLTRALKNQIMLLTKEGLPGKLIARICHCSQSSVRRTIIERVPPYYRLAKLPKHLCFDEFRSTKFDNVVHLL